MSEFMPFHATGLIKRPDYNSKPDPILADTQGRDASEHALMRLRIIWGSGGTRRAMF